MALKQHSSVSRGGAAAPVDRGMIWIAAILLFAIAATLGLKATVSLEALAPIMATLFFGMAAAVFGVGLLLQRYGLPVGITEIAGILTFVGVFVSIAIEPDQMIRLMNLSEQPD